MGRGSATWRSIADRRHDDDGVSLIEVMVALGLLVVLGAGVASSLLVIQKSAFTSKQRSAAANLATREVEVVRNWFHSSDTAPLAVMAAGDTTNGSPLPGQTGAARGRQRPLHRHAHRQLAGRGCGSERLRRRGRRQLPERRGPRRGDLAEHGRGPARRVGHDPHPAQERAQRRQRLPRGQGDQPSRQRERQPHRPGQRPWRRLHRAHRRGRLRDLRAHHRRAATRSR